VFDIFSAQNYFRFSDHGTALDTPVSVFDGTTRTDVSLDPGKMAAADNTLFIVGSETAGIAQFGVGTHFFSLISIILRYYKGCVLNID
jgi:hypothetical protein